MRAAAAADVIPRKTLVGVALKKRFYLRLHMFLILGGTIVVGVAATNLLHAINVTWLPLRYGLSVTFAFAAFVGFVRLWLGYVAVCAAIDRRRAGAQHHRDDWFECIDFGSSGIDFDLGSFSSSSSSSSSGAGNFAEGGGKFGGGGASGSWGEPASSANSNVAAMVPQPKSSGGGGGGGKGGGFSLDFGDDLGMIILVIVLVVVIACAAFYLIWIAPALLTEVAFQAILAASLARKAHKMGSGNWMGSVAKSAAIPFVLVLAAAIALGWYAQRHCPAATTLVESMHCIAPAQ